MQYTVLIILTRHQSGITHTITTRQLDTFLFLDVRILTLLSLRFYLNFALLDFVRISARFPRSRSCSSLLVRLGSIAHSLLVNCRLTSALRFSLQFMSNFAKFCSPFILFQFTLFRNFLTRFWLYFLTLLVHDKSTVIIMSPYCLYCCRSLLSIARRVLKTHLSLARRCQLFPRRLD